MLFNVLCLIVPWASAVSQESTSLLQVNVIKDNDNQQRTDVQSNTEGTAMLSSDVDDNREPLNSIICVAFRIFHTMKYVPDVTCVTPDHFVKAASQIGLGPVGTHGLLTGVFTKTMALQNSTCADMTKLDGTPIEHGMSTGIIDPKWERSRFLNIFGRRGKVSLDDLIQKQSELREAHKDRVDRGWDIQGSELGENLLFPYAAIFDAYGQPVEPLRAVASKEMTTTVLRQIMRDGKVPFEAAPNSAEIGFTSSKQLDLTATTPSMALSLIKAF